MNILTDSIMNTTTVDHNKQAYERFLYLKDQERFRMWIKKIHLDFYLETNLNWSDIVKWLKIRVHRKKLFRLPIFGTPIYEFIAPCDIIKLDGIYKLYPFTETGKLEVTEFPYENGKSVKFPSFVMRLGGELNSSFNINHILYAFRYNPESVNSHIKSILEMNND